MTLDTVNVVFAGIGGQGVILASDLLTAAAFRSGFDVKKSELHGMSQRGGSVSSDVPNCSVCWGSCQGVIGENEVLISTGTRNFKGRAGHPSSKVYLGSAATVTASAIAGEIALASDV